MQCITFIRLNVKKLILMVLQKHLIYDLFPIANLFFLYKCLFCLKGSYVASDKLELL